MCHLELECRLTSCREMGQALKGRVFSWPCTPVDMLVTLSEARGRWSLAPTAALAAAAQGHFHEEKRVFEMQVQPLCLGGMDEEHPETLCSPH